MKTILDYVLDGELGNGTGTVVHRARRLPGHEVVALKRPDPATSAGRERLRHEARVLARCVHSHVVPLLDVVAPGDDHAPHALALALAEGGSLAQRLRDCGPLPADEVAGLAVAIAEALASVHAAGFVHCDVEPANILFGPSGTPWLADFDAATPGRTGAGRDVRDLAAVCLDALGPSPTPPATLTLVPLLEAAACDDPEERPESARELADAIRAAWPSLAWSAVDHSAPSPEPDVAVPARARMAHLPVVNTALVCGAVAVALVGAALVGGSFASGAPAQVGCTPAASWDPHLAEALVRWPDGDRRYRIGEHGDHLVMGDWNGDGRCEPGIYRPSSGEVFLFDRWADGADPLVSQTAEQTGVLDGEAVVVRDGEHDRVDTRVVTGN